MSEKPKISGVVEEHLTREERLAKEEQLTRMTTKTMKKSIFKTLRPSFVLPEVPVLKSRAIALLVERNPEIVPELWTYVLLDDQTYIRGFPWPDKLDQWPPELRFLMELPTVQII